MKSKVRKLQSILLSAVHVGLHEFFKSGLIITDLVWYGKWFKFCFNSEHSHLIR